VHIVVVHQRRLFADDVLWLNYLISIHNSLSFLGFPRIPRLSYDFFF
jgi:hypothetical protein